MTNTEKTYLLISLILFVCIISSNLAFLGKTEAKAKESFPEKMIKEMKLPPEIKKFISKENLEILVWFLFALPVLIVVFSIFNVRRLRKKAQIMYKEYALKNGFSYAPDDKENLAEIIKSDSIFNKNYSSGGLKVVNTLSKNDWDGHMYIFDVRPTASKKNSNSYSSMCYFKLNKSPHVKLFIRKKLPSIIEKLIMKLMTNQNFSHLPTDSYPEFSKHYIVYADDRDTALKFIGQDLAQYLLSNRNHFKAMGTVIQLNQSGILISFQHGNITGTFKSESKLSAFVTFASTIKGYLISKI